MINVIIQYKSVFIGSLKCNSFIKLHCFNKLIISLWIKYTPNDVVDNVTKSFPKWFTFDLNINVNMLEEQINIVSILYHEAHFNLYLIKIVAINDKIDIAINM